MRKIFPVPNHTKKQSYSAWFVREARSQGNNHPPHVICGVHIQSESEPGLLAQGITQQNTSPSSSTQGTAHGVAQAQLVGKISAHHPPSSTGQSNPR